jgi:hypothetical protein
MPNEEQGSGFQVYLVTDLQLKALRERNDPLVSNTLTEIESQSIGALRGYVDAPASEARPLLLDRYRAAIAQIEQDGPAVSNDPNVIHNEPVADERTREEREDRPRGGRSGF